MSLPEWFPLFVYSGFLCLQVSSVSKFHPDTGVTSLGSLVSCVVGREGHCSVTGLCGERSPCMGHTGSAPVRGSCAFPVDTAQAPECCAGRCPQWALRFLPFPGLCSRSGSRVLHKGTDLVGHAFCALPRSEQLRRPGAWRAHCPRWSYILITSPVQADGFPGCALREPSQECRVSPLES